METEENNFKVSRMQDMSVLAAEEQELEFLRESRWAGTARLHRKERDHLSPFHNERVYASYVREVN